MKYSVFITLLLATWCFGNNRIVQFEPEIIELAGTLDLQTFPGPPNYESIQNGDEMERHFYLKLDFPVDVVPKGKRPLNDSELERNVKTIQLAISSKDDALWSHFRKAGKGAKVKIVGSLFHRFTGHHYSRVLMNVKEMKIEGS